MSQSLQGAGGVGGLLAIVDGSLTYHYLYDANGNVGQVLNAGDGSVVAHYEYDPFGNFVNQTGDYAEENPYRFSTKFFDSDTSLYYYGYRYYSAQLGRWISRDPVEEYGGINLYVFVTNDPVLLFDALGETASDVAESFDEQYRKSLAVIDSWVIDDPCFLVVISAATVKTTMDVGRGTVDVLRFGEGVAEGGVWGIVQDLLRGLSISGGAGGSATKLSRLAKAKYLKTAKVYTTADAAQNALIKGPNFRRAQLAQDHYAKHVKGVVIKRKKGVIKKIIVKDSGADMPEIKNFKAYQAKARQMWNRISGPRLHEYRTKSGDILRYDLDEDLFSVMSKDGHIRTLFRPDEKYQYFLEQIGL